jgi:predicted metal-dependent hydrolase
MSRSVKALSRTVKPAPAGRRKLASRHDRARRRAGHLHSGDDAPAHAALAPRRARPEGTRMNKRRGRHETIVPRERPDFRLDETMPRYWYRGDAYKTRTFDGIQSGFPEGERYFIASVRAFRDGIADPVLQQEVRDFMRQEGQHGLAHAHYNALLERQGMPMRQMYEENLRMIGRWQARFSPAFNLAHTAAFEHFTATMAHAYFAEAAVMEGADARMKALLAWHAIEEMEHKSVAFDVMQKVARVGYFTRVGAMAYAIVNMLRLTYRHTDRLLAADGYTRRQRLLLHVRHALWMHGPRKGIYGSLAGTLLAYFRPGFHPTQQPTIHNYRAWLETWERTGDPFAACEALCAAAHR